MIYVHLWDVISTNNDLAVGDTIMFTNDYPKNEDSALSF